MSDALDPPDDGGTPLTADERRDLRPAHIATRGELNLAEQENIARARDWALRMHRRRDILTEAFVMALHRRMLGDVWRWAGTLRRSPRNIGIGHWEIPMALRALLAEAKAWIAYRSYAHDEIAVRLHHRLVQIHPFPSGNGRHARLMADVLVMNLGGFPFTWGGAALIDPGALRARYIAALRRADDHDYGPLVAFARS